MDALAPDGRGGPPPAPSRPDRSFKGPRTRLYAAFLLSAAAHVVALLGATWSSGTSRPGAPRHLIEARIVQTQPASDELAPPASHDQIQPAPAPATQPPPPPPPAIPPSPPPAAPPAPAATSTAAPDTTGTTASAVRPAPAPSPAQATPTATVPTPPSTASPSQARPPASSPRTVNSSLPPAPDYHLAGALDPPPRILEAGEPEYPADLREEGTVVLRLLISASGQLDDVAVARSFPPGMFDESALAAFRQARVAPGRLLGVPVKSQMNVELKYTPINRGPAVSGSGAGLRGLSLPSSAP